MKKLLLLLLLPTAVLAEQVCDYAGSQREMNFCALQDYQEADRALNDAYAKAILKADDIETLRQVQRHWIKRRDARCNPKRSEPGTNGTISYYTCMQDLTEIRTLQLLR